MLEAAEEEASIFHGLALLPQATHSPGIGVARHHNILPGVEAARALDRSQALNKSLTYILYIKSICNMFRSLLLCNDP